MQPDPMILAQLRAAEWDNILPGVLLWAKRCHRRFLSHLKGAPTPEDLVQDAVTDLLTGQRNWPQDVPLCTMLFGIVRSHVSNFLAHSFSRTSDGGRTARRISLSDIPPIRTRGPEGPAAVAGMRMLYADVIDHLRDDKTTRHMVELLKRDPLLKPADLAVMLEVPVHDIYNARKRLARLMVQYSGDARGETDSPD